MRAFVPWLLLALSALAGCASNAPPLVQSDSEGEVFGTLIISGEHPYERQIVLADTLGGYWLVESPQYEGELLQLDGQPIRALGTCRIEPSGQRSLTLRWYDLIPRSDQIAGVGTLERWGDDIVLFTAREGHLEEGQRVLIVDGPLLPAVRAYVGFRIWITGRPVGVEGEGMITALPGTGDAAAAEGGRAGESGKAHDANQATEDGADPARISLIRIIVDGYGVLGPPIPDPQASPQSTPPDSRSR